jgi:hypothetical protein
MEDKDHRINKLEKDLNKYEDKSLKLARTVDKLRTEGGPKVGASPGHTNSINSHYPFPVSSTKKGTPQRQSPAKPPTHNGSGIDYSNMPNFYAKYHQNN